MPHRCHRAGAPTQSDTPPGLPTFQRTTCPPNLSGWRVVHLQRPVRPAGNRCRNRRPCPNAASLLPDRPPARCHRLRADGKSNDPPVTVQAVHLEDTPGRHASQSWHRARLRLGCGARPLPGPWAAAVTFGLTGYERAQMRHHFDLGNKAAPSAQDCTRVSQATAQNSRPIGTP